MAFGKRENGSATPRGANATAAEFAGARIVGADLLQIGDGTDRRGPSDEIEEFLLTRYSDEGGANSETLLSAVGALAGFAAQEAIWEGVVRPGKMTAAQALICVKTKDGGTFYFGDFLNMILVSRQRGELSIWRFVAGAAMTAGAKSLPQLDPAFSHCARTVGSAEFGKPQLPADLTLKELPRDALRHWPSIKSILITAERKPLHWPMEIGVAAQKLILRARGDVAPDVAAWIVMQAAIAMSKVDPTTVPGGTIVES